MILRILALLLLIVVVVSDTTNECNSDDESCHSKEKTYDDLPSSWKDHMPFFDILIQYYKQFSSSFQSSSSSSFKVVDLGVGSGYTSLNFATKLNNTNSNVYGIDIYLNEDRFRYDIHNALIARQNENMLGNLSILIGEWNTISRIWNYPIDILNIDGSYDYNSMKMTIDNWSKYVKRDGIVLIHDIHTNVTTTNNNITTTLTRIHDETLGYYKMFFTYSTGLLALTKNMDLYKRLRVMYGSPVDSIEFLPTFWKGNSPFANWIVYQKNMTNGVIVDLGVDWGYSTMHWANALRNYADADSKVYGIDLFNVKGSAKYQDVMGLISKYNVTNIEIIKDDFGTRAYFWNKQIDILHIDGFHDYHLVKSDFDNWVPHLKLDGIIVFHDLSEVSELEGLEGTLHFFNSLPGPRLLLAASDVNNGCEIPPCSRLGIYTEDRNTYHAIFIKYNGRIIYDDFVSKIKPSSGIGHRLFVEWLVNHQNYKNNNVIVQLGIHIIILKIFS